MSFDSFEFLKSEFEWTMRRNQFESFNVADAVLRLRGCPFGTTKDDVLKFFEGLDLVEGGVVIPNDEMGRCGEATTNNKMKMIKLLKRRGKKTDYGLRVFSMSLLQGQPISHRSVSFMLSFYQF